MTTLAAGSSPAHLSALVPLAYQERSVQDEVAWSDAVRLRGPAVPLRRVLVGLLDLHDEVGWRGGRSVRCGDLRCFATAGLFSQTKQQRIG